MNGQGICNRQQCPLSAWSVKGCWNTKSAVRQSRELSRLDWCSVNDGCQAWSQPSNNVGVLAQKQNQGASPTGHGCAMPLQRLQGPCLRLPTMPGMRTPSSPLVVTPQVVHLRTACAHSLLALRAPRCRRQGVKLMHRTHDSIPFMDPMARQAHTALDPQGRLQLDKLRGPGCSEQLHTMPVYMRMNWMGPSAGLRPLSKLF